MDFFGFRRFSVFGLGDLVRGAEEDVADFDVGWGGEDGEDGVGDVFWLEHFHAGAGFGEGVFAAAEVGV